MTVLAHQLVTMAAMLLLSVIHLAASRPLLPSLAPSATVGEIDIVSSVAYTEYALLVQPRTIVVPALQNELS
jgi:hypothetical protein